MKLVGDHNIFQMTSLLVAAFTREVLLSTWPLDGENGLSELYEMEELWQ